MLMVLITLWSTDSQPDYQVLGPLKDINIIETMPLFGGGGGSLHQSKRISMNFGDKVSVLGF